MGMLLGMLANPDISNEGGGLFKIAESEQRAQQEQQARAQVYYNMLSTNEGVRDQIYFDTEGNPTIGIGFNLNAAHNQKFLKDNNIDKQSLSVVDKEGNTIREGRNLTENEKLLMYNHSLRQAFKDARLYDPRFDRRPESVKMGLVDMAFNMGLTKLKKFVDMKKGLDANDYTTVAKEAKDSDWFRQHQVLAGQRDHRGKRTVALFKKAIYPEGMIR